MARTSNPTEIDAFQSRAQTRTETGVSDFPDTRFAARLLAAIVFELRQALAAEAEYQDLAGRSAAQLTRSGLKRADLPDHIRRRYYT